MNASTMRLALRRIAAFGVDWLLIAAWGAVLFGLTLAIFGGLPPRPPGPWHAQAMGFALITLPVVVYFALMEASVAQATIGKRALGLRLVTADGGRVPLRCIVLRNVVKFVPWVLGHMVAEQAAFTSTAQVPDWIYAPVLVSGGCTAWWLASIFLRGRAPYDVVAATRVVGRTEAAGGVTLPLAST